MRSSAPLLQQTFGGTATACVPVCELLMENLNFFFFMFELQLEGYLLHNKLGIFSIAVKSFQNTLDELNVHRQG